MVALSAFFRFTEYPISGPFTKAVRDLSALRQPGDHARARSALLPFSESSSKTKLSDGHLDMSPEKEKRVHKLLGSLETNNVS